MTVATAWLGFCLLLAGASFLWLLWFYCTLAFLLRQCLPRPLPLKLTWPLLPVKHLMRLENRSFNYGAGSFCKDPISAISFGMALMFGTAGLPHILMRFFTVPDAKEARKSVFWATTWIGYFYILTFIIGFGAICCRLTNPGFVDAKGGFIGGNNMAAVHLAKALGGDIFLGFISAVAFATILAVVAGLTLSGDRLFRMIYIPT